MFGIRYEKLHASKCLLPVWYKYKTCKNYTGFSRSKNVVSPACLINLELTHQPQRYYIMIAPPQLNAPISAMILTNSIRPLKRRLPSSSMDSNNCTTKDETRLPIKKRHLNTQKKTITIPTTTTKQVRFANAKNDNDVKIGCSCEDTWSTKRDLYRFKLDSKESIFALYKLGGNVEKLEHSNEYTIRGLENFLSPTIANQQKQARKERISAVLCQQQLQRSMGTNNPEFLRMVSSLASERSSELAVQRGILDAQIWSELL